MQQKDKISNKLNDYNKMAFLHQSLIANKTILNFCQRIESCRRQGLIWIDILEMSLCLHEAVLDVLYIIGIALLRCSGYNLV